MTELIGLLFLLIGLSLMHSLQKVFVGGSSDSYLKIMNLILFFFFWNSEYLACSILVFAILFYLKDEGKESLTIILKNLLYVMLFTFIFRKIKDVSMQYFIEQNLQQIK